MSEGGREGVREAGKKKGHKHEATQKAEETTSREGAPAASVSHAHMHTCLDVKQEADRHTWQAVLTASEEEGTTEALR